MKKRPYGTGCIMKVKGSKFWYALWRDQHGKQHKESSRSLNRSAAEALLKKRLGEVSLGIKPVDRSLRYEEIRDSLVLDYQNRGHRSLVFRDGQASISGLK